MSEFAGKHMSEKLGGERGNKKEKLEKFHKARLILIRELSWNVNGKGGGRRSKSK